MALTRLLFLGCALLLLKSAHAQCTKYQLYANDSVGCVNDIFSFRIVPKLPSGSIVNWDFEIKTIINDPKPTIAFTKSDSFTCTAFIELPGNQKCTLERVDYIQIAPNPPLGDISSTKKELCELNNQATLTVKSSASSFTWSIDGTVYANRGNSVQHTFTKAGYKQVQIIANTKFGCKSTRVYDSVLLVESSPKVTFPTAELVLCGTTDVTLEPEFSFFGNSDFKYSWNLSGASKSSHTTKTPSKVTYSTPGKYGVTLNMSSNISSCSYDYSFPQYVRVESAPNIKIRATPINGSGCKSLIYGLKLLPGSLDTNKISWFQNHGDSVEIKRIKADSVVLSAKFSGKYVIWAKYELAACDKLTKVKITLESNDIKADFDDDIPCICKIPSQLIVKNKSTSPGSKTLKYEWEVRNVKKGKLLKSSTATDLDWIVDRYGNFVIQLKTIDSDGCYEMKQHTIEARPFDAEIEISPAIACPGAKVRFVPKDTMCYKSFDSVYWTLYELDGKKIKGQKNDFPYYETYDDTGYYKVEVLVTTSTGCRSYIQRDSAVHITTLRKLKVDHGKSEYCLGEAIKVSLATAPKNVDGSWFGYLIGNGHIDTAVYSNEELKFIPSVPGKYDLKVVFITQTCSDSIYYKDAINVGGVLFDFSPEDSGGCLPFSTMLNSKILSNVLINSSSTKLDYAWSLTPSSLGSLLPADSSSARIEINKLGKASVTLSVANADGCVSKLTKADIFNFDLSADFSLPFKNCRGVSIDIINKSKGGIAEIEWSVTAGNAKFLPNNTVFQPILKVKEPGSFMVNLTIKDKFGCAQTLTRNINIVDFDFDFTVDDTLPKCSPASFSFKAFGVNVDTFYWDFGDGEPKVSTINSDYLKVYDLTRITPYRNFFDVVFYAKNNIGCIDSIVSKNLITVRGPVPNFEIVNPIGCSPHEVQFVNKSIAAEKVYFDFGDNASIDSISFKKHTYTIYNPVDEVEIFRPFIVVHDRFDCKLSYIPEDTIFVYSLPIAKFSNTEEVGCSPHNVNFSDSSIFSYDWIWHYGDGNIQNDSSRVVSHVFKTGSYRPYLVVTNKLGCPDTVKTPTRVESLKPPKALFNISDSITCKGIEISFSDSSKFKYPIYHWKWDFGVKSVNDDTANISHPKYTYGIDGNFDVRLIVIDSNGCSDTLLKTNAITIYDELPVTLPEIDYATILNDQNIELSFRQAPKFAFKSYLLHEANQLINDISISKRKDTSVFLPGLETDSNQFCFYVELIDKCGFSHPGDTHCTILLTVDRSQEEVTHLHWTPYIGWDSILNYTIYRGKPGLVLNELIVASPFTTTFIDSSVCNKEYQYEIRATRARDSILTSSNDIEFAPKYVYQLNPLQAYLATVKRSDVVLTWQKSAQRNVKNYIIDRRAHDNFWVKGWRRSQDTLLIDSVAKTQEKSYFYRIRVIDDCGYQSDESNLASSILLRARPTERDFLVYWNPYRDWPRGVTNYVLQRRSVEGAPFRTLAILGANDTSYLDTSAFLLFQNAFSYRLMAIENDAEPDTSISNVRTVEPIPTLYVPNAFSPNGNGVNDLFSFKSVALLPDSVQNSNFEFSVYNRWGEQVFYSNSKEEGWDGTFNGKECEQGVYIYYISAKGLDGSLLYRKGSIHLLK